MSMKQIFALACAAAPVTSLVAPRSATVKTALNAWGPDWDLQPESQCIHGGWAPDPATTARAVPVYRTGPYQFESTEKAAKLFALAELGNIYSRIMNPTTDVLEKRMALLEGAPELGGLGVASGTNAAFYSIINLAQAGDNIVSARNLYGGTYTQFKDILPTLGITVKFVDSNSPKAFAEAADDKTRAFFTETVSNPALDVADIKAISDEAHKLGLPLIVDDTFTTPYLCRPFDHGADIICHSLTKWTGGHGTAIGGIVIDKGTFDWSTGKHPLFTEPDTSYGGLRWGIDLPEMLAPLAYILRMRTVPLRNLGGCMSPDNAWMALQGIETLPMRMEKHCENAMKVATHLSKHPKIEWVRYPGLSRDPMHRLQKTYLKGKGGPLVVIGLKGGRAAGEKMINSLKLFSHVANVGDAKSLAIHPASTTHSQLSDEEQIETGLPPELVRLSVGIEHIDDIIKDLNQALAQIE
jgi:O-acetylhomoserine (thiol)-lyase